jgi:ADP-ribose pyrophosphatase YjhB (NUDIX family)
MEKEVYKGQIIRVTEEKIDHVNWERVYLPDGVIVFPVTEDGKIILIKEKRPHENPPIRLKPVSGILEHDKGSPEENANREMQEEIGLKSLDMELLWVQKGSGTVNHEQHYFIARSLVHHKLPNPDGEEMIMGLVEYTPEELLEALMKEEIRWSMSTLGIFRLLKRLGTLR